MKSIGNTVDIMQILVVSIFTKKGEIEKFFIYLLAMVLHVYKLCDNQTWRYISPR
jgi:hypothetical protein